MDNRPLERIITEEYPSYIKPLSRRERRKKARKASKTKRK